jgi:hydrogenase maturation protein HypF
LVAASFRSSRQAVSVERARVTVRGAVQGVGFRPFVYRLAGELDLKGWVLTNLNGTLQEVEGPSDAVRRFLCA